MNIYSDLSSKLDPNCYTQGREGKPTLVLVCHNTAGPNDNNSPTLDRGTAQTLSDAAARYLTSNDRQVSVQWLVGAEACDAPIYRIVPDDSIAYHAGGSPPQYPSRWVNPDDGSVYGRYGLNQVSIGIELYGQVKDQIGPKQLASLKTLVEDIIHRYPNIGKPGHIVAHAALEGDRTDGLNWVDAAKGWAAALAGGRPIAAPAAAPASRTATVNYKVKVTSGKATVRSGPGRSFSVVGSLDAATGTVYQADSEAHGDAIPDSRQASGSDDVWVHLPTANGFVTRTALTVVN